MNVLIIFYDDNVSGGGAEWVLRQIADEYIRRGANVHILFFCHKNNGYWDSLNYDNLYLYYGGASLLTSILKLRKIIFDYSYSSLVKLTGFIGLLKRLRILHIKAMIGRESTSIFIRYHGLRSIYYKMWYWLGYKGVDILICQTEYMKKQLLDRLPWLEMVSKVVVIPNPVNLEQMYKKSKEELDVSFFSPYIVTAGRFIPEKAYDILIDAFSEIKKDFANLKLVILGEGVLRDQIEEHINRLQLTNHVFLTGHVDNVYPWFKQAILCVVSSRLEGFPNVLLQMMSQNGKVVSTLCAGGIGEIKGLVTCMPNDAGALANAIELSLLDNKSNNRVVFDEELKRRTIEKFINCVESI